MEQARISTLLKLMSNPDRLTMLLMLLEGDRDINELAAAIGRPAPIASNHLTKLRAEGIVDFTRYHRVLEYRLTSPQAQAVLHTLRTLQTPPQLS